MPNHGGGTIFVPISTESSGIPTTRPETGFPVQGVGKGVPYHVDKMV